MQKRKVVVKTRLVLKKTGTVVKKKVGGQKIDLWLNKRGWCHKKYWVKKNTGSKRGIVVQKNSGPKESPYIID